MLSLAAAPVASQTRSEEIPAHQALVLGSCATVFDLNYGWGRPR